MRLYYLAKTNPILFHLVIVDLRVVTALDNGSLPLLIAFTLPRQKVVLARNLDSLSMNRIIPHLHLFPAQKVFDRRDVLWRQIPMPSRNHPRDVKQDSELTRSKRVRLPTLHHILDHTLKMVLVVKSKPSIFPNRFLKMAQLAKHSIRVKIFFSRKKLLSNFFAHCHSWLSN